MKKYFVGLALFIGGALALAGVNGFFAYTNTTEFCTSCHTMQWNYEEYKETRHYKNRAGVQAQCADCHVPKQFIPKVTAKIIAVKDIYHQILGTVDTPEKFEDRRWTMANRVWDKMKASDSRECRTCHEYNDMDFSAQGRSARSKHESAPTRGKTCIDCHQGIVHHMPDEPYDDDGYAPEE
ncbi:MAG: NapC/NirT family cytochrome c [Thiohalomonadaceae bacterium]